MKQTALEFLEGQLIHIRLDVDKNVLKFIDTSIEKAKEMEKKKDGKCNEMLEMLNTIYLSLDDLWQSNDKNEIFNIINVLEIEKLIRL